MNNERNNPITQEHIAIVILNWNGYEDTLECLQSLALCTYNNFEIILVDNASQDNSVAIIKERLHQHNADASLRKFCFEEENRDESSIKVTFIENAENLGFAIGNNIGIAKALELDAGYILLLNNDTTVAPDFLMQLISFFRAHPDYSVATPQIRYFDKPDMIWNCGGRLTASGSRKYFFDDKAFSQLPDKSFLNISFITGCALMAKAGVFKTHGLLSDAFFFGEEDYEFSLRMKKNRVKVACVLPSVIYHKVNSSISKASDSAIGKMYIHYLNRYINLRSYMPAWKWKLWRRVYFLYIFALLKHRHKIKCTTIRNFKKSLFRNSSAMSGVNKQTFENYIHADFNESETITNV